jgi:hypothetical protein
MSVAIHIKFKAPGKSPLSIPVASQGTYHTVWLPMAEKLGLVWVPQFENGPVVDVKELAAVVHEFRTLREAMANNPRHSFIVERIDLILEELGDVSPDEVSEIFVG